MKSVLQRILALAMCVAMCLSMFSGVAVATGDVDETVVEESTESTIAENQEEAMEPSESTEDTNGDVQLLSEGEDTMAVLNLNETLGVSDNESVSFTVETDGYYDFDSSATGDLYLSSSQADYTIRPYDESGGLEYLTAGVYTIQVDLWDGYSGTDLFVTTREAVLEQSVITGGATVNGCSVEIEITYSTPAISDGEYGIYYGQSEEMENGVGFHSSFPVMESNSTSTIWLDLLPNTTYYYMAYFYDCTTETYTYGEVMTLVTGDANAVFMEADITHVMESLRETYSISVPGEGYYAVSMSGMGTIEIYEQSGNVIQSGYNYETEEEDTQVVFLADAGTTYYALCSSQNEGATVKFDTAANLVEQIEIDIEAAIQNNDFIAVTTTEDGYFRFVMDGEYGWLNLYYEDGSSVYVESGDCVELAAGTYLLNCYNSTAIIIETVEAVTEYSVITGDATSSEECSVSASLTYSAPASESGYQYGIMFSMDDSPASDPNVRWTSSDNTMQSSKTHASGGDGFIPETTYYYVAYIYDRATGTYTYGEVKTFDTPQPHGSISQEDGDKEVTTEGGWRIYSFVADTQCYCNVTLKGTGILYVYDSTGKCVATRCENWDETEDVQTSFYADVDKTYYIFFASGEEVTTLSVEQEEIVTEYSVVTGDATVDQYTVNTSLTYSAPETSSGYVYGIRFGFDSDIQSAWCADWSSVGSGDMVADMKADISYSLMPGTTYYYMAYVCDRATGTYTYGEVKSFTTDEADGTLSLDANTAEIDDWQRAMTYSFVPGTSGYYSFTMSGAGTLEVYDATGSLRAGISNVDGAYGENTQRVIWAEAGNTYYIFAHMSSELEAVTLTLADFAEAMPELAVDTTTELLGSVENSYAKFTADETAYYTFTMSVSDQTSLLDAGNDYISRFNDSDTVKLEAGKTVYLCCQAVGEGLTAAVTKFVPVVQEFAVSVAVDPESLTPMGADAQVTYSVPYSLDYLYRVSLVYDRMPISEDEETIMDHMSMNVNLAEYQEFNNESREMILGNLEPDTTYYARAVIRNRSTWEIESISEQVQFKTPQAPAMSMGVDYELLKEEYSAFSFTPEEAGVYVFSVNGEGWAISDDEHGNVLMFRIEAGNTQIVKAKGDMHSEDTSTLRVTKAQDSDLLTELTLDVPEELSGETMRHFIFRVPEEADTYYEFSVGEGRLCVYGEDGTIKYEGFCMDSYKACLLPGETYYISAGGYGEVTGMLTVSTFEPAVTAFAIQLGDAYDVTPIGASIDLSYAVPWAEAGVDYYWEIQYHTKDDAERIIYGSSGTYEVSETLSMGLPYLCPDETYYVSAYLVDNITGDVYYSNEVVFTTDSADELTELEVDSEGVYVTDMSQNGYRFTAPEDGLYYFETTNCYGSVELVTTLAGEHTGSKFNFEGDLLFQASAGETIIFVVNAMEFTGDEEANFRIRRASEVAEPLLVSAGQILAETITLYSFETEYDGVYSFVPVFGRGELLVYDEIGNLQATFTGTFAMELEAGKTYYAVLYPYWWDEETGCGLSVTLEEKAIASSGVCGDNLTWELYNTGELIIEGNGVMDLGGERPWSGSYVTSVELPEGLANIADNAFTGTYISEVTIPDSVTDIGYAAFANCTSLQKVEMGDDLQSIGNQAFQNALLGVETLEIPEGVTHLGENSFSYNRIGTLILPSTIQYIANSAFAWTEIGNLIYSGTDEQWSEVKVGTYNGMLTELRSVNKIGGYCGDDLTWTLHNTGEMVIEGTGAMTEYGYYGNFPWVTEQVYNMSSNVSRVLGDIKTISELTVSEGVTSIAGMAFYGQSELTEVTIPASVQRIGHGAFWQTGLEEITVLNADCTFADGLLIAPLGATIRGYANSTAQVYANAYGYEFEALISEVILKLNGEELITDDADTANIVLAKDASQTLTAELVGGYATPTWTLDDETVVSLATDGVNATLTGLQNGSAQLTVEAGDILKTISISVFTATVESVKDESAAVNTIASSAAAALEDSSMLESSDTAEAVKNAADAGTLVASVTVTKTENISENTQTVMDALTENDETAVVVPLDITVTLNSDEEEIGKLTETQEEVEFAYPMGRDIKEGDAVYILREHDGELDILAPSEVDYENDIVYFRTDRFSAYTVMVTEADLPWSELATEGREATCDNDGLTVMYCELLGVKKNEKIPALGHEWDRNNGVVTKEATCVEPGEITYKCVRCEATKAERIEALGHILSNTVTKPTCTEQGYTTWNCDREGCGYSVNKNFTAPLGHSMTSEVTKAATCTEAGGITHSCTVCDYSYSSTIKALGHAISRGVVMKAAGCETEGVMSYSCLNQGCEHTVTETIPVTGHNYTSVVTSPTCYSEGYTTYTCFCGDTYKDDIVEKVEHVLGEAESITGCGDDCTKQACINDGCSYVVINGTTEHAWDAEYTVDVAATCTANGWQSIHCQNCDATKDGQSVPATDHTYGEYKSNGDATCTADGTETAECECGATHTRVEEGSALGHSDDPEVLKGYAATCTKSGLTDGEKCPDCNAILTPQQTIPAMGHTIVVDAAVAATCTDTGMTAGSHCSVCNAILLKQYKVEATGHVEVIDPSVEMTCTSSGWTEGSHCDICKEILVAQIEIPASHRYDGGKTTTVATCAKPGVETYTCQVCGHSYTVELPMTSHDIVKHEAKAAGCETVGWEAYEACANCEYTTYKEIPVTGHSYNSVVTAPTCEEEGYTTHTCASCGDSYIDSEMEALGHKTELRNAAEATCTIGGYTGDLVCTVCGKTTAYGQEIEAKGHSEVVDAAVAATCTASGLTEGKHCSVCGEVLVAQETIKAKGHTEVVDTAVAATCTKTGLTEGKHCSVCGEVLVAQETIKAKGHTEVVDAAVAATCTASGLTEGKHCSVCGEVLVAQETVKAKGHTEVVDTAVAATCTKTGLTEGKHCSVCGEVLVAQETIKAKGHTEVVDAAVAATCTASGLTEGKHCSVCGEVLVAQETVKAKGHTEVVDAAVAATCTKTGLTEGKHCSVCDEVIVAQEEVEIIDHAWDNGKVTKEPTLKEEGILTFTCASCGDTKTESIPVVTVDINDNGTTDVLDLVTLMKHVVGAETAANTTALDVNKDGKTDILDVIRLARYLAG